MIPREEWLHHAKRLAVGAKRRVNHGCGRTASLDVYNSGDCWSCWCFRCHDGGRVVKEHQTLIVRQEDTSRVHPVPATALHISQVSAYEQRQIWDLLIRKGCPPGIIPEEMLWYDKTTRRILVRQGRIALGRALNEQQFPKWMGYSDTGRMPPLFWTRYPDVEPMGPVILVEDSLSALKVAKAVQHYAPESSVSVAAVLGTVLTVSSLRMVAGRDVLCMFDGDEAGKVGSEVLKKRLAVFGGRFIDIRPEKGDPKDLSLEEIWERLSSLVG